MFLSLDSYDVNCLLYEFFFPRFKGNFFRSSSRDQSRSFYQVISEFHPAIALPWTSFRGFFPGVRPGISPRISLRILLRALPGMFATVSPGISTILPLGISPGAYCGIIRGFPSNRNLSGISLGVPPVEFPHNKK